MQTDRSLSFIFQREIDSIISDFEAFRLQYLCDRRGSDDIGDSCQELQCSLSADSPISDQSRHSTGNHLALWEYKPNADNAANERLYDWYAAQIEIFVDIQQQIRQLQDCVQNEIEGLMHIAASQGKNGRVETPRCRAVRDRILDVGDEVLAFRAALEFAAKGG